MSIKNRRKHIKIIELLKEVIQEIPCLLKNGEEQEILQILADCQDGAIALGGNIEKLYGLETETVVALEQYCNALYQMSVEMNATSFVNLIEATENIRIIYDIEFPERREIVFLPYNASMWDSLESVWKAVCEDKTCDVYIVPIPYYDLDANRNFIKKHYEGNLYPDYVPITSYEEYNLEERNPDVIVIHNPYDGGNRVTSIAPEYYSSNIKNFTDVLVYIPYYILGEVIYDHFCVLPGVINSDYIIVQSENARRTYIKNLKKITNQILENKIIALGSPKIDKVINSSRADYKLPKKWEEILEGKKALLYNTGITGLLSGNELELNKIADVINVFRERTDVVLWWRPHPLNKSTLKAMRPHLYEQYMNLIDLFKTQEIGIFDESGDLYRAIMWTDFYYGDDSSVAYLYGVQGKPIIKQNILVASNRDYTSLDFNVSLYENGKLWMVAKDHNGIYDMDVITGDIQFISMVPEEHAVENKLYSNLIKNDCVLWLVPFRANFLTGYNLITKEFEHYKMNDRIKYSEQHQNKIYMVSYDYKRVWIFDLILKTLCVEEIKFDNQFYEENIPSITEYYSSGLYFENDVMCFVVLHTNILVEYNLKTHMTRVQEIGDKSNKYGRMDFINNKLWFFPVYQSAKTTCWDGKNCIEVDQANYPNEYKNTYGIGACKYWNNLIYLFPARGNMILSLNPETMKINQVMQWDEEFDVENVHIISEEKIVMTISKGCSQRQVCIMNPLGTEVFNFKVEDTRKCSWPRESYFKRLVTENYVSEQSYEYNETETIDLQSLLDAGACEMDFVSLKNYFKNLYMGADGDTGKRIWKYVKERI